MKLVNIMDLKTFLEITVDSQDSLLALIDDMVSARIETWLNRKLVKKVYSKSFTSGKKLYYLPAYPIDLTASLVVTYAGAVQTLNSDYYVWEDEGLIEFYSEPTYVVPKEITIAWTGGYTETTYLGYTYLSNIPDDMKLAAITQIAFTFRRRKDIGISSVSMPDGSFSKNVPLKLLAEVKDMLLPYRRIPAGN
jgi:hypothetical protein